MRSIKFLVSSILLALFCAGIGLAQAPEFQPREEWLGMYVNKGKIGYKHIVIRKDVLDGKPVFRRDEYSRVRGGQPMDLRLTLFCDEKYKPIVTDYEISQDGNKTTGEWTYGKKSITTFDRSSDGTMQNSVSEFPVEVTDYAESCRFAMGTWPLQPKDELFQCTGYLNILSEGLTLAHFMMVEEKKEKIAVSGKEYECLVIDHLLGYDEDDEGNLTPVPSGYKSWVLENGEIIKESNGDIEYPLECLKMTREEAMEGISDVGSRESPYASGEVASSLYLPNSEEIVELHCRMTGLDPLYVAPDDEVQTTKYDKGTRTAEFFIKYKPVDEAKAPQLPVKVGPEFAQYLAEVPGLQVHSADIQKLAHSIIGNETNSWRASLLLRRWCFENMPYSAEATTAHDANDIKGLLLGCCRHYAILYCTLARAVGIPTKMTAGIGYVGNGFGPHAWCESYFGHWVIVDATWFFEEASAVYIKLWELDRPSLYGYGVGLPQLVEILDYKRMPRKCPTIFDNEPRKIPELPKDPKSLIRDEWRGIYVGEIKVGYVHEALHKAVIGNSDVYRKDTTIKMRVKSTTQPGTAVVDYSCTAFADKKFNPIFAVGKNSVKKTGTFFRPPVKPNQQSRDDDDYVFEWDYSPLGCWEAKWEKGVKSMQGINWSLPPAKMLPDGVAYDLGLKKLKVGEEFVATHRRLRDAKMYGGGIGVDDMSTPQTYDGFWDMVAKVKVLKKQQVTLNGKTYDTVVAEDTCGYGATIKRWYLPDGSILKSENDEGTRQIKESPEEAVKGVEGDGPDVSSVPANHEIQNPDKVIECKVKVKGLYIGQLARNAGSQKAKYDKIKHEATMSVVMKPTFDAKKAAVLPVQDSDYAQWLTQESVVNMSDPDIVAQAKEIAGDETNAYKVACELRKWVHDNVALNQNTKVHLDAVEVFKAKEGSRIGKNILLVAMARAVGLPARFIGGLRYDNNRFQWDLWTELYVGDWVQMDSSALTNYVDATHLRFTSPSEFMDTKVYGQVGVVLGCVAVEVMNYKTIDGKTVVFSKETPEPKKKAKTKAKAKAKH